MLSPLASLADILFPFTSVLFILISALLLFGVGTSKTEAACSTAMWLCSTSLSLCVVLTFEETDFSCRAVVLYAGTKATLYALLLEKLYVVHCNGGAGKTPRRASLVPFFVDSLLCFLTFPRQWALGGTEVESSSTFSGLQWPP